MHVVVTSFGSSGDVNPLLAVAAALRRRGVDVTFVANPFYAPRVERTGCEFVGAGRAFDVFAAIEADPRYIESRSAPLAIWRDLVVPSIRDVHPAVVDAVRRLGAAVVVSHVLSYGGAWAAIGAGIPSVVVTTSPSVWLSRHAPVVLGNWRAPAPVQGWLTVAMRGLGGVAAQRPLARLAAELGAPPVADIVRAATLNVGVWPEWFRRRAPDDPPRSEPCGFVFDGDGQGSVSPAVAEFLAAGAPPVVAGFGSAASLHAARRYRAVAEACARLRQRCLLIGASAGTVPASPTVMTVDAASYRHVFPSAAVVVHHGGFGTCAEALRAGKASLVTPFAFDQYDTAARIDDAGLGRWFRGDATDAAAVASALASTLDDDAMRAAVRTAAERIAAAPDGAAHAALLIERLGAGATS